MAISSGLCDTMHYWLNLCLPILSPRGPPKETSRNKVHLHVNTQTRMPMEHIQVRQLCFTVLYLGIMWSDTFRSSSLWVTRAGNVTLQIYITNITNLYL